jgi:hypothetical protein
MSKASRTPPAAGNDEEILSAAYRSMGSSSWYRPTLSLYRLKEFPDRWVVWKSPQDLKYEYLRVLELEAVKQMENKDAPVSSVTLETYTRMLTEAIVAWNLTDPETGEGLAPPARDPTTLGRLPGRVLQDLAVTYMEEMARRAELPLGRASS